MVASSLANCSRSASNRDEFCGVDLVTFTEDAKEGAAEESDLCDDKLKRGTVAIARRNIMIYSPETQQIVLLFVGFDLILQIASFILNRIRRTVGA
mmetsp:Transcript_4952/g.10135  ORF Transcript_4952/g.10135 Transcript_4952/m.10135 type:complete len:96 (-) Transcript_4952:34-321(-)